MTPKFWPEQMEGQSGHFIKKGKQIEHSRHRSFNNFIANALGAIAAYCFFEKKPAIELEFVNDGQLTLF